MNLTAHRLVKILKNPFAVFPRLPRRQQPPEREPEPIFEYHRAEFLDGEWWVLSNSGERLTPYGNDEALAKRCAQTVNERVAYRRAEYARAKANRERIAEYVRENFDCLPNGGVR